MTNWWLSIERRYQLLQKNQNHRFGSTASKAVGNRARNIAAIQNSRPELHIWHTLTPIQPYKRTPSVPYTAGLKLCNCTLSAVSINKIIHTWHKFWLIHIWHPTRLHIAIPRYKVSRHTFLTAIGSIAGQAVSYWALHSPFRSREYPDVHTWHVVALEQVRQFGREQAVHVSFMGLYPDRMSCMSASLLLRCMIRLNARTQLNTPSRYPVQTVWVLNTLH